ncbi:MAG: proline dehydrogenase family protein [Armatimonadetes bacterium]|nr:proline dehydrogenase family protein [Armatimonadota bacterium]
MPRTFRSLILSVAARSWVERFVRKSRITRGVVRRFVAGDSLSEAIAAAEVSVRRGFTVSLDFLGEHTSAEEDAELAAMEYGRLLEAAGSSPEHGGWQPERINISVKLSQLGLDFDSDGCCRRLCSLLDQAQARRQFVRIDMESSPTIDRTLECFWIARERYDNVGAVLQSMLHRTPDDLDALVKKGVRVRLVKGAYQEGPDVAYRDKRDTDSAYIEMARKLALDGIYPAFATHDLRIIQKIIGFAEEKGIGRGRFEFQMLYGVRRDLQEALRKRGYIVRVYIPYGASWYPYFTRRLAERPANLFFFMRSLLGR